MAILITESPDTYEIAYTSPLELVNKTEVDSEQTELITRTLTFATPHYDSYVNQNANSDLFSHVLNIDEFIPRTREQRAIDIGLEITPHQEDFFRQALEHGPPPHFIELLRRHLESDLIPRMAEQGIDLQINFIGTQDQAQLEALLAAGYGVDIFTVTGHPLAEYANRGWLADIYELIEQDTSMDLANFYTNVLELFEIDGRLIAMPTTFVVPLVGVNAQLPPSIIERFASYEIITIPQLVRLYNDLQQTYTGFEHLSMMNARMPGRFLLYELNNFDTNKFSQFLSEIQPALTTGTTFVEHPFQSPRIQALNAENVVFYFKNDALLVAQGLMEIDDPFFIHHIPVAVEEGVLMMYPSWDMPRAIRCKTYAIANNENADLAWEFLKSLMYMDAFIQTHSAGGLNSLATSIRKDWFDERTRTILNDFFPAEPNTWRFHTIPEDMMPPFSATGNSEMEQAAINHAVMRLYTYTNMPMAIPPFIPQNLIAAPLRDFINNELTASEMANLIYERLNTWLHE